MNKLLYRIFLFYMIISCKSETTKLTDIDGNQYSITKYGETFWMTENLKVRRDINGNNIKYFFPDNNSGNVQLYGLLYDFETACKVCPQGWRLPNNEDWEKLFNFSKDNVAGNYKDKQFWKGEINSNDSGFSIRPSGIGNNEEHPNNFGENTLFWSDSKEEEHFIWTYILEKGKNKIRKASQHPTYAFSIRCIK
ncbi:uncharacterized protein (TIGR02145 family) [Aquimarina sp. EL_43]|uniref:fibrobacter succinogenes major paralogous domain-containing protein n=1 Tax=unclassified Aquimarina TaxID=2627091 RepID=UPI0018CA7AD2|nr:MULTISPECIES: fibrobacter succinogenes major paralogous domain-containing protein [unclassified Aquimarina]MBG6130260.1 uncharacterized protein (TIGR02145 family) [Aquimarina sp. EL_35]MBG6149040.1 uncharacterized protein (TIGR02145 family) [Aquimarina sp. EL_32]MBG6168586.1 uncharacterized protein (TIGR02145 family) [Aquimarina sp. EL_43]